MARAAVKAKQAQRTGAQQAKAPAGRRAHGRKRHASGGNPNQQLFFMRLRRKAKGAYLVLAILFALTFAFLGVGSGTSGLDQLFSNLNIFHSSGTSVSKAQKEVQKHPSDPTGFRDLATAYESKGDTAGAITALQQYTTLKPKDVRTWNELAGLQLTEAQSFQNDYANAYANLQLSSPSTAFSPTGKLGTAVGTNAIEVAAAQQANTVVQGLQSKTLLAYDAAVSSYKQVTKLQPRSADGQFQLAQAAYSAGDTTTAVAAYKAYLKLNPTSSSAASIRAIIKQLSPAPAKPAKKPKSSK